MHWSERKLKKKTSIQLQTKWIITASGKIISKSIIKWFNNVVFLITWIEVRKTFWRNTPVMNLIPAPVMKMNLEEKKTKDDGD